MNTVFGSGSEASQCQVVEYNILLLEENIIYVWVEKNKYATHGHHIYLPLHKEMANARKITDSHLPTHTWKSAWIASNHYIDQPHLYKNQLDLYFSTSGYPPNIIVATNIKGGNFEW